jgi:hypothetical protein
VIVEGAGGLLVRLDTDGGTLLDLAAGLPRSGVEVEVVRRDVGAGLGTLNHTELTVEALRSRGIEPAGLVIGSWPAEPEAAQTCRTPAGLRRFDTVGAQVCAASRGGSVGGDQLRDGVGELRDGLGVSSRVRAPRVGVRELDVLDDPGRTGHARRLAGCPRGPTGRRTGRRQCPRRRVGLSLREPAPNGREAQSMALLSTAGMVPLYSGVTTRTRSDAATWSRNARAASGAASPSMSSL